MSFGQVCASRYLASSFTVCDSSGPRAFICRRFLVSTKPVKMLQNGYNASGIGPYQYELAIHSLTIALHCGVTLRHHCDSASGVWSPCRNAMHAPHGGNGHKSILRAQIGERGLSPIYAGLTQKVHSSFEARNAALPVLRHDWR
jgi:hypothetical protein